MKKWKIITLSSICVAGLGLASGVIFWQLFHKDRIIDNVDNSTYLQAYNYQSPIISSFNNFEQKIVNNNIDRNIVTDEYETALYKNYSSYGFRYPSYDYNYELGNNKYFTVNGTQMNASDLVYEERTPADEFNKTYKYSDPTFIRNEIKNNSLKIHPAAKGIHKFNLSDDQKAVDKYFSISSYAVGITSLGLYCGPGEIIELTFDDNTYNLMKENNINNFQVIINSSYWDNKASNDTGQISNRYPFIKTVFSINLNDLDENHTFKFGSPFGGSISVFINSQIPTPNTDYRTYKNYVFNVKGACETLSYYHGYTTNEDWNNQIERVKNNELTAPNLALDFSYGSTNISFTDKYVIGYENIDNIDYPFEAINKWSDFLFLSEYFASKDYENQIVKIDFEFNDDVWGNAAAWGGWGYLYAPLSWAKKLFTSDKWTISNDWGLFHEINHNFEQNDALFLKRTHDETNQVTLANFSLLNDVGRFRNPYNYTSEYTNSGWTRMDNMYSTIKSIVNSNYNIGDSEYEIYNLLLYMVGTYNYMNYVRNDINTMNVNGKEGGFYEILELSDYFKLNFYPALQNYYSIWNDNLNSYTDNQKWPSSYENATSWQKQEISRISTNYKAIDFVANLYAAGIYIYDQNSDEYIYTCDTQPYYSIPVGRQYTFDFEKGINWLNNHPDSYNFSWSRLEFNPTTKLGGRLELDPNNNKKLIYSPPLNCIDQIDEFDIAIIPDNFLGKPNNYVSKYKWKIKVRQVGNAPLVSWYDNVPSDLTSYYCDFDRKLEYILNNSDKPTYENVDDISSGLFQSYSNNAQYMKIEYTFVAPEDGEYSFKIKQNFQMAIYDANNMQKPIMKDTDVVNNGHYSGDYFWLTNDNNEKYVRHLKKSESIPFVIYLLNGPFCGYNNYNALKFDMKVVLNNNENCINLMDCVYDTTASEYISFNPNEFITNEKYHYISRTVDYNNFQTSMFGLSDSRENISLYDPSIYTFSSIKPSNDSTIDIKLKNKDGNQYEVWGANSSSSTYQPATSIFEVKFNEPTKIQTLKFDFVKNNTTQGRPLNVRIWDENNQVLFDGVFGSQFYDRNQSTSFLSFDQSHIVNKLKIYLYNNEPSNTQTKQCGILIDSISFSNDLFLNINRKISILNPNIVLNGKWSYVYNGDNENFSDVNASSIKSIEENDSLSFNIYCQGFDIIGQKNIDNSNFDVYINDELIANVSTNNDSRIDNAILYKYTQKSENLLNIKIVNKSNKPLYLDFIQTYGKNVYIV